MSYIIKTDTACNIKQNGKLIELKKNHQCDVCWKDFEVKDILVWQCIAICYSCWMNFSQEIIDIMAQFIPLNRSRLEDSKNV